MLIYNPFDWFGPVMTNTIHINTLHNMFLINIYLMDVENSSTRSKSVARYIHNKLYHWIVLHCIFLFTNFIIYINLNFQLECSYPILTLKWTIINNVCYYSLCCTILILITTFIFSNCIYDMKNNIIMIWNLVLFAMEFAWIIHHLAALH